MGKSIWPLPKKKLMPARIGLKIITAAVTMVASLSTCSRKMARTEPDKNQKNKQKKTSWEKVNSFPNVKTKTDGMYASMQLALSRTLWPLLLRQTMVGLRESRCCQSPSRPRLPSPTSPARQHLWPVFKWCRSCSEHTNATASDLFASCVREVSGLSVKARQIMPRAFSKF